MERYGDYEYEKIKLRHVGDYDTWDYRITNLKTGGRFKYRIKISGTALSASGEMIEIQDAVATQGESIVKKMLSEGNQVWIKVEVGIGNIKKTFGEWGD